MRSIYMETHYTGNDYNPHDNYVDLRLTDIDYIERCRLSQYVRERQSFTIVPDNIKVVKVIYHNPATIVFWSDGTKTVVKCDKNDTYDPEKGFYIACTKKLFGNDYRAGGKINKALKMAVTKGDLK